MTDGIVVRTDGRNKTSSLIKTLFWFVSLAGYAASTHFFSSFGETNISAIREFFLIIMVAGAVVYLAKAFFSKKLSSFEVACIYFLLYTILLFLFSGSLDARQLKDSVFLVISFFFAMSFFGHVGSDVGLYCRLFLVLEVFFFVFYSVTFVLGGNVKTVNTVYYQLCLLPLILLSKEKRVLFLGFSLVTISVFASQKRVAFIIWLIWSFYLVFFARKKTSRFSSTPVFLPVAAFGLVIGLFLVILKNFVAIPIVDRFFSIASDGGSGRIDLLYDAFALLRRNSLWETLFGHQLHSTAELLSGLGAHNDFVELYYRMGFFGLAIFSIAIFLLVRMSNKRAKKAISAWAVATLLSFFTLMLFSQILFLATYNCFFGFALAYFVTVSKERTSWYERV